MVTSSSTTVSGGSSLRFTVYEVPAALLVLALCVVTLISLTRPESMALHQSATLAVAIASTSLLVALGAAYFALGEFLLYGVLSSLCVGLAFLVFAGADAGLGLLPLLGGWPHEATWVSYGWGVQRIAGGVLLVTAALTVDRLVPLYRRPRLVVNSVILALLLTCSVTALCVYLRPVSVSAVFETPLQLAAGVLFFASSALFWRVSKRSQRTWFFWLSLSLAIAGFSQLQFAIRQYPLGVVQPGDVLSVVFFTGILLALAAQLGQDYRRLRWQARELEALHALMAVPSIEDGQAVVQHVVRVVGNTLQATARILMAERGGYHGKDPLTAQMMQLDTDSLFGGDGEDERRLVVGFDEGPRGVLALGVPLYTSSRRLGMLVITRSAGNEFSTHDVRLLRAFGTQASVLLERSMLYEEVAAGAILQERSRLAREIHDGLAQHLAFLKMRVAWLQRSPPPTDTSQLKDIEGVLETALIEARHAITTLRAEPEGTSAPEAIDAYAQEFGQVSGLNVAVTYESNLSGVGPKTRVELLRVVQEALNNVRKHAQASNVAIGIVPQGPGLAITIKDDGRGFSPDRDLNGHFGLEIMRERAESVGGKLEVNSVPSGGTQVCVWVPTHEADSESSEDNWVGSPLP